MIEGVGRANRARASPDAGARHPFLNDLLALDGLHRIASVTLEPSKWRPSMPWLRYSCLRAGCVDGRGVTYWVEAQLLHMIPPALAQAPWAAALEAARISRFTPGEWDAYISVGMAIQDKRGALSLARKKGYRAGLLEGFASYCKERRIDLSAEERREMGRLNLKGLQAMINRIKAERGRPPREWS